MFEANHKKEALGLAMNSSACRKPFHRRACACLRAPARASVGPRRSERLGPLFVFDSKMTFFPTTQ